MKFKNNSYKTKKKLKKLVILSFIFSFFFNPLVLSNFFSLKHNSAGQNPKSAIFQYDNPVIYKSHIIYNNSSHFGYEHSIKVNEEVVIIFELFNCENLSYFFLIDKEISDWGLISDDRANLTIELNFDIVGEYEISFLIIDIEFEVDLSTYIQKETLYFSIGQKFTLSEFEILGIFVGFVGITIALPMISKLIISKKLVFKNLSSHLLKTHVDPSVSMEIQNDLFLSKKEITRIIKRQKKLPYLDIDINVIDDFQFIKNIH